MGTLTNSIGLAFDIIGAVMIWKFGLPENISREGNMYLVAEGSDKKEKEKASRYDRYSQIGILALILGFALQLVSNFL